jgi:hypothetical protein
MAIFPKSGNKLKSNDTDLQISPVATATKPNTKPNPINNNKTHCYTTTSKNLLQS